MSGKSLWERTVELTITVGERILAPIERYIGKRSLVGDATFFDNERFPWIAHVEDKSCAAPDQSCFRQPDRAAPEAQR